MSSKETPRLPVPFRYAVHGWIDEVLTSRREKRPYSPAKALALALEYEQAEKRKAK